MGSPQSGGSPNLSDPNVLAEWVNRALGIFSYYQTGGVLDVSSSERLLLSRLGNELGPRGVRKVNETIARLGLRDSTPGSSGGLHYVRTGVRVTPEHVMLGQPIPLNAPSTAGFSMPIRQIVELANLALIDLRDKGRLVPGRDHILQVDDDDLKGVAETIGSDPAEVEHCLGVLGQLGLMCAYCKDGAFYHFVDGKVEEVTESMVVRGKAVVEWPARVGELLPALSPATPPAEPALQQPAPVAMPGVTQVSAGRAQEIINGLIKAIRKLEEDVVRLTAQNAELQTGHRRVQGLLQIVRELEGQKSTLEQTVTDLQRTLGERDAQLEELQARVSSYEQQEQVTLAEVDEVFKRYGVGD